MHAVRFQHWEGVFGQRGGTAETDGDFQELEQEEQVGQMGVEGEGVSEEVVHLVDGQEGVLPSVGLKVGDDPEELFRTPEVLDVYLLMTLRRR